MFVAGDSRSDKEFFGRMFWIGFKYRLFYVHTVLCFWLCFLGTLNVFMYILPGVT